MQVAVPYPWAALIDMTWYYRLMQHFLSVHHGFSTLIPVFSCLY